MLRGHQLQMKCADPLSLGPYLLWEGAQLISHQKNIHGFWLQKFYHHLTRALMHFKGCLKHQKYQKISDFYMFYRTYSLQTAAISKRFELESWDWSRIEDKLS